MRRKSLAMNSHAGRRMHERHGIELTEHLKSTIIKQIQTGTNAEFVLKQSNRVSIWKTETLVNKGIFKKELGLETIYVVYDKQRKLIITVLPKEAHRSYQEVIDSRLNPSKPQGVP